VCVWEREKDIVEYQNRVADNDVWQFTGEYLCRCRTAADDVNLFEAEVDKYAAFRELATAVNSNAGKFIVHTR